MGLHPSGSEVSRCAVASCDLGATARAYWFVMWMIAILSSTGCSTIEDIEDSCSTFQSEAGQDHCTVGWIMLGATAVALTIEAAAGLAEMGQDIAEASFPRRSKERKSHTTGEEIGECITPLSDSLLNDGVVNDDSSAIPRGEAANNIQPDRDDIVTQNWRKLPELVQALEHELGDQVTNVYAKERGQNVWELRAKLTDGEDVRIGATDLSTGDVYSLKELDNLMGYVSPGLGPIDYLGLAWASGSIIKSIGSKVLKNVGRSGAVQASKILESEGARTAFRRKYIDPFSGESFPISATSKGGPSFNTSILADKGENLAYNKALERGEIGLQIPTGANVRGADFITAARDANGNVTEIIITDVKTSTAGNFRKAKTVVPGTWYEAAAKAISPERLKLGNFRLEKQIRDAFEDGRIRPRQLNVDYQSKLGAQGTISGWCD